MNPIAYYVHHHGRGHERRFAAIRSVIGDDLIAVSELDLREGAPGSIVLPTDVGDSPPVDPSAGGALHWAPLDSSSASPRLARFTTFLDDVRPVGVVVDVSVEAAVTCRLAGIPVVYVRQHGRRDDPAHQFAYRSAARLLAPWPEALEDPATPSWVVEKTDYSGFVVERRSHDPGASCARSDDIVVVAGAGGGTLRRSVIAGIADSTGRRVISVGPHATRDGDGCRGARRGQVIELGWIDDLPELLSNGPLVVATAGDNTVALAAASGCALIATPMTRPFDEQLAHARRLDDVGAAVCVESPDDLTDWCALAELAERRRDALRGFSRPDGAARAAAAILTSLGR